MDLPLLQNNNIFTSCRFPNPKTFIPNEQTMEADCKKQVKDKQDQDGYGRNPIFVKTVKQVV